MPLEPETIRFPYRGIEDTDTERHNEAAVDAILQLCRMVDSGVRTKIKVHPFQTHQLNNLDVNWDLLDTEGNN